MDSHSLLSTPFIPVQHQGSMAKITLQQLLCGEKVGELCLPRDDMELACLQMLVAMTQVCFTPPNKKALIKCIQQPLTEKEFLEGVKGKEEWFDMNHPETPFMQFRGVKASVPTPMNKLLAGVADGTNKAFVNPEGLVDGLCESCTAIGLFNMANNCPSMGGGFKGSLRGSTPITQLIKGSDLRKTLWLNVLHQEQLDKVMPWYQDTKAQKPNYIDPVKSKDTVPATSIGLAKGLLWQPAHFELLPSSCCGHCSLCGAEEKLYKGFNKEKFNYTIQGIWPHPLSPRIYKITKGKKEEKFPSFTTSAPGWTQLSRFVFAQESDKSGQTPSPVLSQAQGKLVKAGRIQFVLGGYRNNQATVLERRHEFFSLANGWEEHGNQIHHIIETGLGYKTALRKALYLFAIGIKDKIRGSGVNLCDTAESLYYQSTEEAVHNTLARIDFNHPANAIDELHGQLKQAVHSIFDQITQPYRQEPKMLKALALARRSLNKSLADLTPNTSQEN